MDVIARKKRMDGYNVLFPIGYDAFGLPTENLKVTSAPVDLPIQLRCWVLTRSMKSNFTRQLHMLGYSFDWDRCVDTTDPGYYKCKT